MEQGRKRKSATVNKKGQKTKNNFSRGEYADAITELHRQGRFTTPELRGAFKINSFKKKPKTAASLNTLIKKKEFGPLVLSMCDNPRFLHIQDDIIQRLNL